MAEEVKPIKTERIDNSDGTYTINEWYKTGKEIAISYLSNTFYSNFEVININNSDICARDARLIARIGDTRRSVIK